MYIYATALEAATPVAFVVWVWAYSIPKPTSRFFNHQHIKSVTNLDIYKGCKRMYIRQWTVIHMAVALTALKQSAKVSNPPHTPATTKERERRTSVSALRDTTCSLTSYTYYRTAVTCKNLCLHRALFRYSQGDNKHDILDYKFWGLNIIINLNHKTKGKFYTVHFRQESALHGLENTAYSHAIKRRVLLVKQLI